MEVRAEQPGDIEAIRNANVEAFGQEGEANLVNRLRGVASTLSFVAIESERVVGHIFFSPVEIERECADGLLVLGLAPVAVLPDYQRQGIGSLLIRHSLKECAQFGFKAIVVLGSSKYYPRFGFVAAKEKGFRCEYAVPDEAFMVLELEKGGLDGCAGLVKYRSEFNMLE